MDKKALRYRIERLEIWKEWLEQKIVELENRLNTPQKSIEPKPPKMINLPRGIHLTKGFKK